MESAGDFAGGIKAKDRLIVNINDTCCGIDGETAIGCEHRGGRGIGVEGRRIERYECAHMVAQPIAPKALVFPDCAIRVVGGNSVGETVEIDSAFFCECLE